MSAFDKTHRDPVDRTAALVVSKGIAPPFIRTGKPKAHREQIAWVMARPQYQGPSGNVRDRRGEQKGLLTVVAYYGRKKTTQQWICRCVCGEMEVRSSLSLNKPGADKCQSCKKLDYWKAEEPKQKRLSL